MVHARFLAFFTLLWIFLLPEMAHAQGYKISGRIVDAETLEPLPYAHVFIDQTTIGAVSDFNGEYAIENLSNGEYKLVYSFVGYELFYKTVSIIGKDVRVSARLVPQQEVLQNVEVKGTRDKEWESQLRQFNRVFFGDTDLAANCRILNPWVLEFDYVKSEKKFKATASAPLEIENRSLGYSIVCNLLGFTFDKSSYRIKGLYKFEEINTLDPKEAARWTRNRRQAYQNSLRFLMKSMVEQHASENGFGLYQDNRPAVYTSHTGLFSVEQEKNNVSRLDLSDKVLPAGRPGYYKLLLEKRTEIHHTTQFARSKTYRDIPYPISWIEVDKGYLLVGSDGVILNNDDVVTSGELNLNRIASMLPLNYSPGSFVVVNYLTKRNVAKRLQERAFLQTDKIVYYPHENIWFKVHMNYANQTVRDSLSKVLYVDIINENENVVQSKILKLDSVGGSGTFLISNAFKPGKYYLRAYTSWMRNYGPELIQYTPVLISNNSTKLVLERKRPRLGGDDFVLDVLADSPDSSSLLLLLDSGLFQEPANCAVSISPAELTLDYVNSVKDVFSFEEDLPNGSLPDFVYPIEDGFSLSGKISYKNKRARQGIITAIRGKMDSLYTIKTNKRGEFDIQNLNFQDTVFFSFQAKNRKGKVSGRTELLPRQMPEVSVKKLKIDFDVDTIQLISPIQLQYRQDDTTRIVQESNRREDNSSLVVYADHILTNSDLEKMPGGQSIISALQGKVPGLHYDFSRRSISFRENTLSNGESAEPLIIVDGIPMFSPQSNKLQANDAAKQRQAQQDIPNKENTQNTPESQALRQDPNLLNVQVQPMQEQGGGTATDMISHITVSNVSRVEITTRMDPRYGTMGANGVISIYTKKIQGRGAEVNPFDIFQMEGFARPQSFFRAINYSTNSLAPYTPTWYWNPAIQISSREFTQIKFPVLPKGVVFRVNIVGVTKTGVPVSGSFLLNAGGAKPLRASLDQRQK